MSGTVRAGLIFGLAAIVAFVAGLILPIPCVNVLLAFGSVIALGYGAGFTGAKTTGAGPGQGVGRGATAGAIGGLVTLIGSTIALLVLGNVLLNIPGVREQLSAGLQEGLRQNPGAANPDIDPGALFGVGFGIAGFCLGGINFVLMVIGGLIGGALWKGAPAAASYGAPGSPSYGAPAGGSYIPNQTSSSPGSQSYTTPGDTDAEGGARVYDNDPNRPR